jgi:hypothetical protein
MGVISMSLPDEWDVDDFATRKRKFASLQDYIRELIRRDIEVFEKEEKSAKEKK